MRSRPLISVRSAARVFCLSLFLLAAGIRFRSKIGSTHVPPRTHASSSVVQAAETQAEQVPFQVVKSYPHDRNAFTQGLLWYNGALYESTGREGQSSLRRVDLTTGRVLRLRRLPNEIFGEGLALAGDRFIQISWQNKRAFVYDHHTFDLLGEWRYDGEGWGLTFDGKNLIMSDGSEYLTWRDPKTFEEQKRLAVTFNGKALPNLNELEWINGEVWANVWQTNYIVRIDPQSGAVREYLDCSELLGKGRRGREDVLNGIAYDPTTGRIFVTGKLWPRMFEIKLHDPNAR